MTAQLAGWILVALLTIQPQAPATATLTGRVVDEPTGAPIARAIVYVQSSGRNKSVQKLTGPDGRFELTGLPAGEYFLTATAGEFKATHVGPRPITGAPIRLKPGEAREVPIALGRARAITGRVVDEAGLPLSGVRIRLRDLSTGSDYYAFGQSQSNDLGDFRVFGLAAGRYLVCAEGNANPSFRATEPAAQVRFVRTCYPSSLDTENAQPIVVRTADVEGVEIRMRRSRTFTISGVVVDSGGTPRTSYALELTRVERDGSSGSSQHVQAGRFNVTNVVPGRYVVSAEIRPEQSSSNPEEKGSVPIEVTSADVDDLVITMKKPVSVRGIVTFEDGVPPNIETAKLRVAPSRVRPELSFSGLRFGQVQPDLTFRIENLFGPFALTLGGLPVDHVVKSIRYRNRDILDQATEFDGDPRYPVEIVVTGRTAELSGRVLDERGNPAASSTIHVFPADPARWQAWRHGGGRSNDAGAFRVRGLAAGDYLMVVLSEQDQKEILAAEWYRPNPYERLATIAERITLLESDRRIADLRLTPIPQEWKR
jgi:protocatechuate 3,4-dioxygenase beta subunit